MPPEPAAPPEPAPSWPRTEAILLVLLYLGVRAAFLAANPTYFYNSIDGYLGVAAQDVLRGDALPLLDRQYNDYNPATWVAIAAAVPFVRLGGPFHQSVNAALLFLHALAFAGWLFFGMRYVGRRATRWAALLWAVPPPFLLWMGLALKGGHHLMLLPQLLGLACLIELRRAPEGARARERRLLFLLGISTGLGSWWTLHFWTAPPLLAALLLLESRRRLRADALAALGAGFLLGYGPALYYNATRPLAGYSVQETPMWRFFLDAPREAPGRLGAILAEELPAFHRFPRPELGTLYAGATLAAWAFVVWTRRAELRRFSPRRGVREAAPPFSPALYVALLYALFFGFLALSSFAREADYFATPMIHGAILLGLALAALAERGFLRAAAAGGGALLLASGVSLAALFLQADPARAPATAPSDDKYGFWLGYRYAEDPAFVLRRIAAFPEARRPQFLKGAGYGMAWLRLSTPPRPSQTAALAAVADGIPPDLRAAFWDGVAVKLWGAASGEPDAARRLGRVLFATRGLSPSDASALAAAALRDETDFSASGDAADERAGLERLLAAAPEALRPEALARYAWRRAKARLGRGYPIGDVADFAPEAPGVRAYLAEFADAAPEARRAALRRLGAALALGAIGETARPASAAAWEAARAGARDGEEFREILAGYAEGAVLALGDDSRLPDSRLAPNLREGTRPLSGGERAEIAASFAALLANAAPPPGVSPAALATARARLRAAAPAPPAAP